MNNKLYSSIFFSACLFFVLTICPAHATDELFLTGTIKRIDALSGTVAIDVKSGGCRGERNFYLKQIPQDSIGKKISFIINSSVCRGNEIYRIIRIMSPGEKR